jgi:hypothetical protein
MKSNCEKANVQTSILSLLFKFNFPIFCFICTLSILRINYFVTLLFLQCFYYKYKYIYQYQYQYQYQYNHRYFLLLFYNFYSWVASP